MDVRVYKTEGAGHRDITQLLPSFAWSGDYNSAVRELSGELLSPLYGNFPIVEIKLGDQLTLDVDGITKFAGMVVTRGRDPDSSSINFRCFDRGQILKRNKVTYQFTNTTPEAAVAKIAADFGIELGEIATTGISITRNFVCADIYGIIQTMYTLASEKNGKKYVQRFDALKFCVFEKVKPSDPVRIAAEVNLQGMSVSESIANLVNRVQILNKSNAVTSTQEDAASISDFGVFQEQIKESDTSTDKAAKTLRDGGQEQKITVHNLGDIRAITGTVVELKEPVTGLVGEFFVDSDVHEWKRGQYYNKLTLNFKNIMDEKSSGSEK